MRFPRASTIARLTPRSQGRKRSAPLARRLSTVSKVLAKAVASPKAASSLARAQLDAALGDATAFASTFETVLKRLASGADRFLPWDRGVSLAIVLARGKRMDLSRVQVQRCLKDIDEARLRSLTTYSLFHLLGLGKAFGLAIADPRLRNLSLDLLPTDLRNCL